MAETRDIVKWVAIGCGSVLLLIVIAVVGCFGLCAGGIYALTGPPVDASQGFLTDLRSNNFQGAYQRMSPDYRSTRTVEVFQQNVGQIPALTQQSGVSLMNRQVMNNTATMGGTLTSPQGGVPVSISLVKIGEDWFITSVTVRDVILQ